MPFAPNFLANLASVGVSALALTSRTEISSDQFKKSFNPSSKAGSTNSISPEITFPDAPSMVIKSNSLKTLPSDIFIFLFLESIFKEFAPTIQGRPNPLAVTAAWLVIPPRSVNTPFVKCIPLISSGPVSNFTNIVGIS